MRFDNESESLQFRMVANSGGLCVSGKHPHPVILDLASMKIPEPVQIWFRHEVLLGLATASIRKGRKLVCGGVLGHEWGGFLTDHIRQHADRGELLQASARTRSETIVPYEEGESVRVNRREFDGPLFVARDAVVTELSITLDEEPADPGSWFVVEGTMEYDYLSAGFPSRKRLLDDLIKCQRAERDLAKHTDNIRAQWAAKREAEQYENQQAWLAQRGHEIEENRLRSMDVHDTIVAAGQPRRQVVEPVKDVIVELNQKQKQAELDRQQDALATVMARRPKPYGSYTARFAQNLEEAESGRG